MRKIIGHRLNRNDTRFYVMVRDSEKRAIEVWEHRAEPDASPKLLKEWSFNGFNSHEVHPVINRAITESLARRNAELLIGAMSRMSEAPADAQIQPQT